MTSLPDVRVESKISCQNYINVWLSMMSGYGANPIFFHKKKIKIGRPEHTLTPRLPTSDNISFCLTRPLPPPSKWTSYVQHPVYGRIRVSENLYSGIFYAVFYSILVNYLLFCLVIHPCPISLNFLWPLVYC